MMFPTVKDKIVNVNRFCEGQSADNRGEAIAKPSFLPSIELEKIVRLEIKNRNQNSIISNTMPNMSINERKMSFNTIH